jgi:putative pyruvate formate lyase activating enzyme
MPDFKMWDSGVGLSTLLQNYRRRHGAIKEMHRQVGELKMDERGLAKRGVLIRHLVMPGGIAGTREITKFLAREISPNTYLNLMAQYSPAYKVSDEKFPEINRPITQQEYADAMTAAQKAGLHRFDAR